MRSTKWLYEVSLLVELLRPFAGRRIDELDPRWFRSLFGAGEPGGAKLAQLQKDFDGFSVQMPRLITGATCHKHSWEHGTCKNFLLEFWRCIVSQFDFKGVCQHLTWFFPFWGYGNQMKGVCDVQTAPFQSNPAMVSMFLKAFRLRDYNSQ